MIDAPGKAPAAVTRERILDVAEALFAEYGYAGASVRVIAASAELTPAALYNHFAGKRELYEAVLDRGVRPLFELMTGLALAEQADDAGAPVITAVMEHLASRPHLARLIHHEAVTGGSHLASLAQDWIGPLMSQAIAVIEREDDSWPREDYPLFIAAWLHLVLGHFAMAPLLGELLGKDPLSPEAIAHQTRFLQRLARRLRPASPAAEPAEEKH